MPRRPTLILLVLLAGSTWWLAQTRDDGALAPAFNDASNIDYYLKDLHGVTLRQDDGQPARTLYAAEARHLSGSGVTELDRPVMLVHQQDGPPWKIISETGEISPKGDWVYLNGEVEIIREAAENIRPVHVITRNARVRPEQAYVETDESVKIHSKADWIHAVGMRGWLREPINIQLLQRVKSFYAPPS